MGLGSGFRLRQKVRRRRLVLVAAPTMVLGLGRLGATALGARSVWTRALLGGASL